MKKKIAYYGEARLSMLRDDLIVEILSRIPTKEAIGTSFLSKRWENLWKPVEGLDITFIKYTQYTPDKNSATTMSKLLSAKNSPNHVKLILHAKGLHIDADTNFFFRGQNLECQVYDSSCDFPMENLVRLQLHEARCRVMPSSSYSLPHLQILVLDSVYMSRNLVEHLISVCPNLQSLYINNTSGFEYVRISHQKLRYLVASRCVFCELLAPDLSYLELNGVKAVLNGKETGGRVFIDVPSLAMCVIHSMNSEYLGFYCSRLYLWEMILSDFHHARTMHLDHIYILELSRVPIPREKMVECTSIFIKIKVELPFKYIEALPTILPVFSGIEKLTFVLEEHNFNRQGYARLWKPLVKVLSEFEQLKEVEVYGFIFNENADDDPDATRTLFSLITKKLEVPKKLKLDTSNDEHKFQILMEEHIHKGNRNLLSSSTFEGVDLPSYSFNDTCLFLYMD